MTLTIGEGCATRTTAEVCGGVVPLDTHFPPGDVRRYGARAIDTVESKTPPLESVPGNGGIPR